eukprot:CAMPEP_0175102126 /NCGR_PEP_ID=MMETSP0086_2-20121207/8239_1 /TAXON_ID=136419 /ORGANISM="Unknown Unknown, Strain D1" /LENGTH=640 /DNA_ID=CAMNT_0016376853 /DNA_START=185 /DNA_END=2104 /DNA_ORIENTATION=+
MTLLETDHRSQWSYTTLFVVIVVLIALAGIVFAMKPRSPSLASHGRDAMYHLQTHTRLQASSDAASESHLDHKPAARGTQARHPEKQQPTDQTDSVPKNQKTVAQIPSTAPSDSPQPPDVANSSEPSDSKPPKPRADQHRTPFAPLSVATSEQNGDFLEATDLIHWDLQDLPTWVQCATREEQIVLHDSPPPGLPCPLRYFRLHPSNFRFAVGANVLAKPSAHFLSKLDSENRSWTQTAAASAVHGDEQPLDGPTEDASGFLVRWTLVPHFPRPCKNSSFTKLRGPASAMALANKVRIMSQTFRTLYPTLSFSRPESSHEDKESKEDKGDRVNATPYLPALVSAAEALWMFKVSDPKGSWAFRSGISAALAKDLAVGGCAPFRRLETQAMEFLLYSHNLPDDDEPEPDSRVSQDQTAFVMVLLSVALGLQSTTQGPTKSKEEYFRRLETRLLGLGPSPDLLSAIRAAYQDRGPAAVAKYRDSDVFVRTHWDGKMKDNATPRQQPSRQFPKTLRFALHNACCFLTRLHLDLESNGADDRPALRFAPQLFRDWARRFWEARSLIRLQEDGRTLHQNVTVIDRVKDPFQFLFETRKRPNGPKSTELKAWLPPNALITVITNDSCFAHHGPKTSTWAQWVTSIW